MLIGIDVRPLMHGRVSGVENYMRALLQALFEGDEENQYVLFFNSWKKLDPFLPEYDGRRVKVVQTRYPNKLLHLMWRFLKWPKIDKLIEKKIGKKIEVLFVPDPRPTPVSKSIRKVTTFHDLAFQRYPQHFSWRSRLWYRVLHPEHEIKTSDHIIAVSEFTKNELMDLHAVDEKKITVIHEAIPGDLKPETSEETLSRVQKKYKLPERFFLTFSTLEPRKNLESVMKAFSIFQKKHPLETYCLVLAGRRDPKMFGKVFLKDHPDIVVTGFVDEEDKAAIYSLARGLLFVSTYEGFGLPLLEAMVCGTPVVTSSVSSMPEVVAEAAILVDPYDIGKIADAMERLTMDEAFEEYQEKGFARVKQFDWKKAAKKTLKVLTSP